MAFDSETFSGEVYRGRELPLEGLRAIAEARRTLDGVESLLAVEARRRFATWAQIGSALGISRQAAFVRHRACVNATSGDSPGDSPRPFS